MNYKIAMTQLGDVIGLHICLHLKDERVMRGMILDVMDGSFEFGPFLNPIQQGLPDIYPDEPFAIYYSEVNFDDIRCWNEEKHRWLKWTWDDDGEKWKIKDE